MGQQKESDAAMMQLLNIEAPFFISLAHAMRGEPDQAFDRLDKMPNTGNWRLGSIKFQPFLRNLHDDPC